jgi:hypothetical protein
MNTTSFPLCRVFCVWLPLTLVLLMNPNQAAAIEADDEEAGGPEVVVGITPSCPSGATVCSANISAALLQLNGIASISSPLEPYNCTVQVRLKQGTNPLPDVRKWQEEFKSFVGESYVFRGVEVTLDGALEKKDGKLSLRLEGFPRPVAISALKHKLQWNYFKGRARGPEDDERTAYKQLERKSKASKGTMLKVRLTGPLQTADNGAVLEVREFFLLTPYTYEGGRY